MIAKNGSNYSNHDWQFMLEEINVLVLILVLVLVSYLVIAKSVDTNESPIFSNSKRFFTAWPWFLTKTPLRKLETYHGSCRLKGMATSFESVRLRWFLDVFCGCEKHLSSRKIYADLVTKWFMISSHRPTLLYHVIFNVWTILKSLFYIEQTGSHPDWNQKNGLDVDYFYESVEIIKIHGKIDQVCKSLWYSPYDWWII